MKKLLYLLALFPVLSLAGTATLTCTAPTTNTDASAIRPPITYKVYRGTTSAGVLSATVPLTTVTTCNYTDAAAPTGTVFYSVTANTVDGESDKTAPVSVVIPAPRPSPPTNVQITVLLADNGAYKLRQAVDGFSLVKIGTIPVGTVCDSTKQINEYSLVPRSNVTLASRFDTMPLNVFAKCA